MKKIAIILSLIAFILTVTSCGNEGPEANAEKLIKKYEKYTEVANKAADDKILDEGEIKKLRKLGKRIDNFEKNIDKKYKDDKEGKEIYEEYLENSGVYNELFTAIMALYRCKDSDRLEL